MVLEGKEMAVAGMTKAEMKILVSNTTRTLI
jgi:hypothetical protein